MAAADDKSRKSSKTSKSSDVVFAYCSVCKANYDDYLGQCLCNSDVLQSPEKREVETQKEDSKDAQKIGNGTENLSGEQCVHKERLQDSFDIKVQNMDTPGDTCLSRSETMSASERCPSLNIVLEEQCATDVCEEIGLSTVCAITENVLGRREKRAPPLLPEIGLRAVDAVMADRSNVSTSSTTTLLQEIGADVLVSDENPKKRTFDVFIVDKEGNMDTYELSKVQSGKGSHIVVNKKEHGRFFRNTAAEEPAKSILDQLGVVSGGAEQGPCAYCDGITNQVGSSRSNRGSKCPRCSCEFTARREDAASNASAKDTEPCHAADQSAVHNKAMIMRPIEDSASVPNSEREHIPESSQFGNTIIFEEGSAAQSQPRTFTTKSRVSLRRSGKVARLIQFYESLSKKGDENRVCPESKENNDSPKK